jgi:hypothetical protein
VLSPFLLVRQFLHIFNLILYSSNTRKNGLTIVPTDEDIPPFSFFRFLVINSAQTQTQETQVMVGTTSTTASTSVNVK